jgi:hypothetical protein
MQSPIQPLIDKAIELRNAGGMDAVDRWFDTYQKMIPWEYCYDCDCITPRDPLSVKLKCLFEEEHE